MVYRTERQNRATRAAERVRIGTGRGPPAFGPVILLDASFIR